jgi:flagellar biosynthesis GTPase FlhF
MSLAQCLQLLERHFNYNIASSKYILRDLETSLGEVSVYFHIKSAVGKTEKARKLSVEWVPTICDKDTYNKITEVYPDDIDHFEVHDDFATIWWKPSEISKSEINEDPSCSIAFDEDGNVVEGEEEEDEAQEKEQEVKEEPAKKKGGRPKKSEEEKESAKKAKEEAKAEKEAEKARKKAEKEAEKASKKKTSDKKKKVEPEPEDENVEDENVEDENVEE